MTDSLARLTSLRKHQETLREREDRMLRHDQEVLGLELTEDKDQIFAEDLETLDRLADEHEAAQKLNSSLENPLNWLDSSIWAPADLLTENVP
jgi:hypothetical protein